MKKYNIKRGEKMTECVCVGGGGWHWLEMLFYIGRPWIRSHLRRDADARREPGLGGRAFW